MITRGLLALPVQQSATYPPNFIIGAWVKITMQELQNIANQNDDPIGYGRLLNDLPFYGWGADQIVRVQYNDARSNFHEPDILLDSPDSEVHQHQQSGIPVDLYLTWMEKLSQKNFCL